MMSDALGTAFWDWMCGTTRGLGLGFE